MFIYYIKNKLNDKCYIGQTTQSITKRKYRHLFDLKNKEHNNKHLQRAWNKYGEGAFEFGVLEEGFESIDELNEAECFWISILQTLSPDGYNLESGGENYVRHKETTELLKKIKSKVVYQYGLDGKFISEWENCVEVPFHSGAISSACRGELITCYGFQWRYKEDKPPKKLKEAKAVKRKLNVHTTPIRIYDLNGKFIRDYKSMVCFCEEFNVDSGNIKSSIDRKGRVKNFQVRYLSGVTPNKIKEYKHHRSRPILQFSLNGKLLNRFKSCTEAKKSLKVKSEQAIYNCAKGYSKTSYNYKWEFDNE